MGTPSPVADAGLVLRFAARAAADLGRYAARTGRWWLPLVVVVLMVGSIVVLMTKVAVPAVVYTLF